MVLRTAAWVGALAALMTDSYKLQNGDYGASPLTNGVSVIRF